MERCIIHEQLWCAICNGDAKRAEDDEKLTVIRHDDTLPPGLVAAQFPGHCADCGRSYDEGEVIRMSRSAEGWVPVSCCG